MGNSASTEAPKKGFKAAHKLSKPKTGNPTSTSLLSSNGFSESTRRVPNTKPLPLRPEYTSPPSPMHRPSETEPEFFSGEEGPLWQEGQYWNDSPYASFSTEQGQFDDSGHVGLGLMWESSGFSVPGAMGNNLSGQSPEGTAARLSRTGSEVSLYTPMRRRSFLTTPGVATRTAAPVTRMPSNPRTRNSLPSAPARRASLEPTRVDSFAVPLAADDPASIPRALTPSDADYKQTGAFKLGTLRITNGSPTRSPTAGPASEDEEGRVLQPSSRAQAKSDYFGKRLVDDDAKVLPRKGYSIPEGAPTRQGSLRPYSMPPLSHDNSRLTKAQVSHQNLQDGLMGQLSPPATTPTPRSPQLQVTSKHTAAEDDLFEDEPRESFSIEVLDVRIDPNAKPHPPRPGPASDGKITTELSRADSGIGAGPVSEVPFKPLAKADSGYSSNVSLRSCSSRRHMHERDTHSGGESNCPKTPLHDRAIKAEEQRSTGAGLEIWDGASRLSVPEEDHSTNSDAARVTSPPPRRNRRLLSSLKKSKSSISEADNRGEDRVGAQIPAESKSGSTSLTNSISTLSIDVAARNQRGLRRFLSLARAPFTVNTTHTHPSEQTGIPPVPQDAQEKLHKRSRSFPKPIRTDILRSERSKDTLGTILSVGSAEASGDGIEAVSPSRAEKRNSPNMEIEQRYPNPSKVLDDRRTSTVHDTASFAARKLGARTSMHQRVKSEDLGENTKLVPPRHPNRGSTRIDSGNRRLEDRSLPAAGSETRAHLVPTPTRTNSATPPTIRSLQSRSSAPKVTAGASAYAPRFPTPAELPPTTKSPPPVSMKTRNQGCVTYRPKYAPPGAPRLRSAPQLVHRESREEPSSHPRNAAASHSTATPIAREPSFENVRGYSFKQPQPFLHYEPSSSLPTYPEVDVRQWRVSSTKTGEYRVPNQNIPPNNDTYRVKGPSFEFDKQYSISIYSTPSSAASSRANSFQDQALQSNPQPVRHRSSYDGHTGLHPRNDPYFPPTPQKKGHAYTPNARSAHLRSQQLNQPARNISYVPRRHHRNHSWGSCDPHGNPLPYRVLHSYNSPAYRNAPIWG
ncbi:hypothetical protein DL762_009125 [Monosporascus cannonballus]|uniref:Proteophosphoglycan ppg4 n=1 Tax=Monosporascus cannonballus TaxID=155416 RepID=A0ABY0GU86_9PEZI|nr:hypothetical protein DL762_009125 [Monosporascus cannonballus]